MGFFKSLKGEKKNDSTYSADAHQPESAPPAYNDNYTTASGSQKISGSSYGKQNPSHIQADELESRSHPTSQISSQQQFQSVYSPLPPADTKTDNYLPPPGPPPHRPLSAQESEEEYAPPPRPPPGLHSSTTAAVDNPPPYHDWTVIPDTSLLPPSPSLPNDSSSTTNASYSEAEQGHAWCAANPVYKPAMPSQGLIDEVIEGRHELLAPPGVVGILRRVVDQNHAAAASAASPVAIFNINTTAAAVTGGKGKAKAKSKSRLFSSSPATSGRSVEKDQSFLTILPLYFAAVDNPLRARTDSKIPSHVLPVTIYFEIQIVSLPNGDSSTIALGYTAKPYPLFRQPGWHRSSIGVHSDDGRRFVNDPWGGRDFVAAFEVGDTLGLGMVFSPRPVEGRPTTFSQDGMKKGPKGSGTLTEIQTVKTRVFFTRNGKFEGSWEMDEERDAEKDEGIDGLQGEGDLYAAVGTFGEVVANVRFFRRGYGYSLPVGFAELDNRT